MHVGMMVLSAAYAIRCTSFSWFVEGSLMAKTCCSFPFFFRFVGMMMFRNSLYFAFEFFFSSVDSLSRQRCKDAICYFFSRKE